MDAAAPVHIWTVGPDDQLNADDADLLSTDERERAASFVAPDVGARFIRRRAWLRIIVGAFLGAEPASLGFVPGAGGKPALVSDEVAFNASHSDDWTAVAISAGPAVGIDIEHRRPITNAGDLARRFFQAQEADALARVPAGLRDDAFLACWTRKEAVLKADGRGMRAGLDTLMVGSDPLAPEGLEVMLAERRFVVADADLHEDLAAAVALEDAPFRVVAEPIPAF